MNSKEGIIDFGKANLNKLMLKFSIPCIMSLLIYEAEGKPSLNRARVTCNRPETE